MPELLMKTISQRSFTINADDTSTIGELKQKIEESQGKETFPAEGQKLIFNGKVLEDTVTVAELKIEPPKFIVVMCVKKPAPKPAADSQAATSSSATPSADEQKKKEEKPASKEEKRGQQAKPEAANAEIPPEHAETVANIAAMGYPQEEVYRALRAAFFNADRAVEYLCNGIPEGQIGNAIAGEAESGEEGDEDEAAPDMSFLAQNPQFQQLRELIRADPSTLPQIMQQIADTNPQLMEMITNHQDEFLQLLNAGPGGGEGGGEAAVAAGGGAAVGGGQQGAGGGPRRISIPVTAQDREAINRLVGMGFPEALVIEAYIACDKDEAMAVNYVLARMEEENEMAGAGGGGQQQGGNGGGGDGGQQ